MPQDGPATSVYDITATSWDQQSVPLDRFRHQVLLVVNVASRCGFTPQYAALEAMYRRYRDRGFVVLAFPCNQFGRQESGAISAIHDFCRERFDVTFPLFDKVDVNGPHAHPLFVYLKSQKAGWLGTAAIRWNFTKFLVDRSGRVVARFGSRTTPQSIEPTIEALLAAGTSEASAGSGPA